MSVDLACGELAFVDLTFAGLDALPGRGEERHARDLLRSPGGGAITAIGAARLGLGVALASPLGEDAEGDFLRARLAAEGVLRARPDRGPHRRDRGPPGRGRAHDGDVRPGAGAGRRARGGCAARRGALTPRCAAPPGPVPYATVGTPTRAPACARTCATPRALVVNEREAELLTGAAGAEAAALALGDRTPCAVVTRGPDGAVAAAGGAPVHAPGIAAAPSTPPAPATSSPPPTSGRTGSARSSRSGCAGPSSTRPSPSRPRRASAAR